jgi:hypothetical protein
MRPVLEIERCLRLLTWLAIQSTLAALLMVTATCRLSALS